MAHRRVAPHRSVASPALGEGVDEELAADEGTLEHRTSPATGSPSSCERQGRTAVSPPSRTTTGARIGHRFPPTAGPGRTWPDTRHGPWPSFLLVSGRVVL